MRQIVSATRRHLLSILFTCLTHDKPFSAHKPELKPGELLFESRCRRTCEILAWNTAAGMSSLGPGLSHVGVMNCCK